jgi:hypothetical protein
VAINACFIDEERSSLLRPCMATDEMLSIARRYCPFDPFADPDGFPICCISKRAVVYSCGVVALRGEDVEHDHPSGELELCRDLAVRAANVMDGVEVGMGSEGTPEGGSDHFLPFYVACTGRRKCTGPLTEQQVRAAFGGVISPGCVVRVEPLIEAGRWWRSVGHWYSDSDEGERNPKLRRWRAMLEWFASQDAFQATAFVMIGDGPEHGGAVFPRVALGVTRAGSLTGIMGCVVHT